MDIFFAILIYVLPPIFIFVLTLIFFIWFSRRLNTIADHAERQTKLLASIANNVSEEPETEAQSAPIYRVV